MFLPIIFFFNYHWKPVKNYQKETPQNLTVSHLGALSWLQAWIQTFVGRPMWTGWTRETIMAIIAPQEIITIYNAVQYFFGVWVVKYSTRWGPPIGKCISPWKLLRTGKTNCLFFPEKPHLFIWGSTVRLGEPVAED